MATTTNWSEADTAAAKRIWDQYQRERDLSNQLGKAAGIDPQTGEVWIGDDIVDIVLQRKSKGLTNPLSFVRIGASTFFMKGRRA